jgi:membrane protein DedA with SNARE-associated domain
MSTDTRRRGAGRNGRGSQPQPMTEEELYELELAEAARVNSGDWDSVKPGKAKDFGASFRRMLGLLAPWKWQFAFVSLLVPATVILFGIGGMIGLSGIEYWSIWVAAAIGAIVGDWLAYVLAARFQHQRVHVWPLSRHPELVSRGFAFFERWGMAAVFLGRFLGPLRAIVPIAAGVCGMSWIRFQIANAASAVVWAAAVLAPGTFGFRWLMLGD